MNRQPTDPEQSSSGEIAALVVELAELARNAPGRLAERVAALSVREQAELALRLPPRERLELLLHAPKPMRLVRALPDSELYLSVRELDPTETLPLLALSSADQIRHLLDLECWRKDRFDAGRAGAWTAVLLEAGEPTFRRFLNAVDEPLMALLFQRWLRVSQIESEDGPERYSVHGGTSDERGLVSPDGNHIFSPIIPEHATIARSIAELFYRSKPERYLAALWSAVQTLPSELEEEALHWRNSRLEEHGFPPWEEALSIYAPPDGTAARPEPLPPTDPDGLAAPRAPLRVLAGRGPLAQALDRLPDPARERVLHEVISVGNRLLVADGADTGDPEAHRRALGIAAGYVTIALETRGQDQVEGALEALAERPLIELFREGYARAADLRGRARRLSDAGWAGAHPRAVDMLDAPFRDRVVALLERRPLYLDLPDDGTAAELRPFRSLAEIDETRVALDMAETIGGFVAGHLGLDVHAVIRDAETRGIEPPKFSRLFLTLLAWHAARGELRGDPLPADVAQDFLRTVASRRTAPADAPARALAALMRAAATTFELEPRDLSRLERFGVACLEPLAAECGGLDPGVPPDSRFVACLSLKPAADV